ncbi:hypothetical protein [Nakamurella leprariae]|uniref:Uncharacterized protein n=1 Tax=Nakamurella leprariae TaxID=2803911 RepID=A0A938YC67_9ACTN|nr:hypothetical protein [Nakamurella leprariae]MBM9467927.1 hypothetical protein [Nakamurella leprariae]
MRLLAGALAALLLTGAAGCGSPGARPDGAGDDLGTAPAVSSATTPTAGAVAGSSRGPVITVPALPGADTPPSGAVPSDVVPSDAVPSDSTAAAPDAPTAGLTPDPASESAGPGTPDAAPTTDGSAPAQAPPASPVAPAPGAPPVDLSACPGCAVLASAAGVQGALGAALITTGGRALLVSVDAGGALRGTINVPYGTAFAADALRCDPAARCIVVGRQGDGRAVLSAFQLTTTGAWRDVSGNDAFPSGTDQGRAVDLGGGELGIAVQDGSADPALWLVFGWSGDRYTVIGCSAELDVAALDPATCRS